MGDPRRVHLFSPFITSERKVSTSSTRTILPAKRMKQVGLEDEKTYRDYYTSYSLDTDLQRCYFNKELRTLVTTCPRGMNYLEILNCFTPSLQRSDTTLRQMTSAMHKTLHILIFVPRTALYCNLAISQCHLRSALTLTALSRGALSSDN